jgi:hypothetical protein
VRFIAGLVCGLALSAGACGSTPAATPLPDGDLLAISDGGVVSCTLVELFDAGQTATLCFEVPASGAQSLQQSCGQGDLTAPADAGSVTLRNVPCSRADALGGCRTSAYGLIQDQWYYGSGGDSGTSVFGQTASDIKMLCSDMGDSYLAP